MTDSPKPSSSSLVSNEQIKLTATYLNGVAIATFAVGGLAPMVALLSGSLSAQLGEIGGLAGVCATASAVIHYGARRQLKGLRP